MNAKEMVQTVTSAVIAVIAVVGTLALIAFQVTNNRPVQLPDILIAMDFAVIGAYISHAASVNGGRQAGTAAAQTAIAAFQKTNGTTPGTS